MVESESSSSGASRRIDQTMRMIVQMIAARNSFLIKYGHVGISFSDISTSFSFASVGPLIKANALYLPFSFDSSGLLSIFFMYLPRSHQFTRIPAGSGLQPEPKHFGSIVRLSTHDEVCKIEPAKEVWIASLPLA